MLLAATLLMFAPFAGKTATTYTISDDTFNPSLWSQTLTTTAPGATAGFSQAASGGNPGSFGVIDISIPTAGDYYSMTVYTGQTYSPATQGPISSINFSADFKAVSYGADYFFGFTQGGPSYFLWQFFSATSGNWLNASASASSASSFYDIFSYAPPNLVNGAPIQFGLYVGYGVTGPGFVPRSFGVDNYQVIVTTVPEPSVSAIGTLAFAALAARRWKTRRMNDDRG